MSQSHLAVAPVSQSARSGYRWAILATIVLGQVAASGFFLIWSAITPFIRDDFGLSRGQVGLVVGAMAIGSALASMPMGRVGDRIGPRRTIAAGLAAEAVLGVFATLSQSFWLLLVGLVVAGLAYGTANPNGIKALVPWFPRQELGTAVAIKQIGVPLGGALGAMAIPALALAVGTWRLPTAALAALIGVMSFVSLAVVRDAPAGRPRASAPTGRWWTPILRRNVLLLAWVGLLFSGVQTAWFGYLVLYSQETLGLSVTAGAGFLALSLFSAVPGRILLGLLCDRVCGGRWRGLLLGCGVIGALCCVLLSLLASPPGWVVGLIVIAFGLTGASWPALQILALAAEGGERSSGITVGLGMGCAGIGVFVTPPLFGLAVDALGSYGLAWQGLALVGLVATAFTATIRERTTATTTVVTSR